MKNLNKPPRKKACKYCVNGSPSKIKYGSIFCAVYEKWVNPNDKCNKFIFDATQFDEQYQPMGLKD